MSVQKLTGHSADRCRFAREQAFSGGGFSLHKTSGGDPAGVRTIMLRLYRKGTDREYSQFDFKGTLAELINYIRTPLYNLDNYYERIMKMSAKCDDYWEENG